MDFSIDSLRSDFVLLIGLCINIQSLSFLFTLKLRGIGMALFQGELEISFA